MYLPQERSTTITYRGKIEEGRVVLVEPTPRLPEGASVRIEVLDPPPAVENQDPLDDLSDLATETGISDLAENVDHYLYDHPKIER